MVEKHHDKDFELLLKMAGDKTAAGRKALVDAVSDLFFGNQDVLSDREKALMTDILRQIVHDVEMSVRRELAKRLADRNNVPRDLVVTLANDDIEVAHPVLLDSELLHDTDLIEIIHHRTLEHQLAIAMRKSLNESVTDALAETGNEDVIKTMLKNANARISKGTMAYLVDQSKRVDTYQNPLMKRPELEPELAKRMYWWVSAALRKHIVENFDVDPTELDDTLEDTVKQAIGKAAADRDKAQTPMDLADRLAESDEITPRLLVQILRQGEVPLFEALFAKLTGLRMRLVRRMLFEPGGEALAIACKAVDIDKPTFASLFLLSRKARSDEEVVNQRELTRVLELFDQIKVESAKAVLKKWRRDPGYLDAIRSLDSATGDDEEA